MTLEEPQSRGAKGPRKTARQQVGRTRRGLSTASLVLLPPPSPLHGDPQALPDPGTPALGQYLSCRGRDTHSPLNLAWHHWLSHQHPGPQQPCRRLRVCACGNTKSSLSPPLPCASSAPHMLPEHHLRARCQTGAGRPRTGEADRSMGPWHLTQGLTWGTDTSGVSPAHPPLSPPGLCACRGAPFSPRLCRADTYLLNATSSRKPARISLSEQLH